MFTFCMCTFFTLPQWLSRYAGDSADTGPIPGSGRSPGEGNGNPLQCSCLENSMDKEAWQARVPGVTKSQTQLSMHAHICRCQSYLNKMVLKREREREETLQCIIHYLIRGSPLWPLRKIILVLRNFLYSSEIYRPEDSALWT